MNSMNMKIAVAIVAGLLAGFLFGRATAPESVPATDSPDEAGEVTGAPVVPAVTPNAPIAQPNTQVAVDLPGAYLIEVSDQRAGNEVVVSRASLPADSWLVAHEQTNGNPGKILGAQWVPAGNHTNVGITLLRGTEVGLTYYVMVHTSDDIYGFNYNGGDKPLFNEDGTIVLKAFKALSN